MKITDHTILTELSGSLKGVDNKAKEKATPANESRNVADDSVTISQKSREVQKSIKVVEQLPDVREGKVKELQQSIENGSYNVKGEAIAESMIKDSLLDTIL
ncbi:MAG: flagellar biosynthesis anti-sigma factor FlgM [Deltaproteobacteria bacterium]|nr:flagellar biosynthesis anti-sigma factor FlgM [Deltaproteobacteria bacterium]